MEEQDEDNLVSKKKPSTSVQESEHEEGMATSEDEGYSTTEEATCTDKDLDSFKRNRFQNEMQILHRELEIALPYVTATNRFRRKIPRPQRPYFTRKRKELEKEDHEYCAGKSVIREKLRGPKKALHLGIDAVSSLIHRKDDKKYSSDIDDVDVETGDERSEGYQTDNTNYTSMSEADFTEDEDNGFITEDEKKVESDEDNQQIDAPKQQLRKLHKLRNFKSEKLVKYHGEALSAFARGFNDEAIKTLQKVASNVPDAPQIYSSLGMVYETCLFNKKLELNKQEDVNERRNKIKELIHVAKKAYGANHIAAFLFRKDYNLWVRAADIANEISLHHDEMLRLSPPETSLSEKHRFEKYQWIEEALKDYKMADNLHPPGINIPIRLANVYLQLGYFSEALSILTDLRSCPTHDNELNRNYGAWLFYADVMLRLGHECKIFNGAGKTSYSEKGYTLRRWLKLYSRIFDWKERRLQALCLAMEAGSGTANCRNLMHWIKQRSVIQAQEKSSNQSGNENDLNGRTNGIVQFSLSLENLIIKQIKPAEEINIIAEHERNDGSNNALLNDGTKRLEQQKENLFQSNKEELKAFDLETTELGFEDSFERKEERDVLVKKHRHSIVDLIGSYHFQQHKLPIDHSSSLLPMTASISSISQITSQLLYICLDMKLYQGGIFVAEAMSSYLKERVQRKKRMKAKLEFFQQKQKRNIEKDMFPYESQGHDEIRDETDESDEDDDCQVILSDDDEFDTVIDSTSLQQLPEDIQLLQTFCFLGKGGADYVSTKAINRLIPSLPPEGELHLEEEMIDTEMYPDPSWLVFQHRSHSMLSVTEAFVYLSQFVRSHEEIKEIQWSEKFLHLFKEHLNLLEKNKILSRDGINNAPSPTSNNIATDYLNNLYQEFLIALTRMQLMACKKTSNESLDPKEAKLVELGTSTSSGPTTPSDAVTNAFFVLTLIERYRDTLWQSTFDIINPISLEMLQYASEASSILMKNLEEQKYEVSSSNDLRSKLFSLISRIFEVNLFSDRNSTIIDETKNWKSFPLSSAWQSAAHKVISKQTYNLCIGCSVSTFSGWEIEEFSVACMRKDRRKIRSHGGGQVYFGVHVRSPQVCGLLDSKFEKLLIDQWSDVVNELPDLSDFDFQERLSSTKESEWYKLILKRYQTEQGHKVVSKNGESYVITLLLHFSKLCLSRVTLKTLTRVEKEGYFRIAFSILFPLTRFCLNEDIWDSLIGTAASRKSSEEEYKYIKWISNIDDNNLSTETYVKKSKRYKNVPTIDETIVIKKRSKFVPVSVSISLNEWLTCDFLEEDMPDFDHKEQASAAMERLNDAMKQLRDCVSVQACQKSFITAAVALLDLVSLGACHNPFVCLHQAAIFSSHGAQGGCSDIPFKKSLLSIEDISALEALVILGRADCMRALSFIDQAMFLCTFILRICSLRRSCKNPDFMWNPKWRIVGIHAYVVSAAIDDNIISLPGCDVRKSPPLPWDKDIIKEIKCCRNDAIALNTSYDVQGNFTISISGEEEEESSDSEDENDVEADEVEADEVEAYEEEANNLVESNDVNPSATAGTSYEDYFLESNVEQSYEEPSEVFAI